MAAKSSAMGARAKAPASVSAEARYPIREVSFDAPYHWLAAGWRDLWRVPGVSLAYGAMFAVAGLLLALGLTQIGLDSLMLVLAGGFILIGPMLAAGLYEASRRLEKGETVSLAETLRYGFFKTGQLAYMGLLLTLIFLAWVEIAFLLFMLFYGPEPMPPFATFLTNLLLTPRGVALLVVGTSVGAVLAAATYAISAISVPLLMVERVDVVTAAITSVNACRKNPKAMALWAVLIAAIMGLGFVTLLLGLVIAFPLIGHSTWHAFRDLVERGKST